MNEYGESDPIDSTRPLEGPGSPAPTWQWTGTSPGTSAAAGSPTGFGPTDGSAEAPTMAVPSLGAPPSGWPYAALPAPPPADASEQARPRISRRTRALGVAAAILLVGGA